MKSIETIKKETKPEVKEEKKVETKTPSVVKKTRKKKSESFITTPVLPLDIAGDPVATLTDNLEETSSNSISIQDLIPEE